MLYRISAVWTGLTGLPGVSVFYAMDPEDTSFIASLRGAFAAAADLFPSTLSIQVENTGDILDDATGTLTGSWSGTAALPVTGVAAVATHAAGVGLRVRWNTAGIVDGRRVQGRTFLAPISTFNFQSDGTLIPDAIADGQAFGNALVADGRFAVWSRPVTADSSATPPIVGRAGSAHLITGAVVPDQVSSLRSRRT